MIRFPVMEIVVLNAPGYHPFETIYPDPIPEMDTICSSLRVGLLHAQWNVVELNQQDQQESMKPSPFQSGFLFLLIGAY